MSLPPVGNCSVVVAGCVTVGEDTSLVVTVVGSVVVPGLLLVFSVISDVN